MNWAGRHFSFGRIGAWLRKGFSRHLICALLLFAAGIDPATRWIAMAMSSADACSCCHGKEGACCRRSHQSPAWQSRSDCSENCFCALGARFSEVTWVSLAGLPFPIPAPARATVVATSESTASRHDFSLYQRPPPLLF